jgi:hypothetical protein
LGEGTAISERARTLRRYLYLVIVIVSALLALARCEPAIRLLEQPPPPMIVVAPTQVTTSATFRYTDSDSGVSYRCTLDAVRLHDCPLAGVAYRRLHDGVHHFRIAARRGHLLSTSVTWTWTVVAHRIHANENDLGAEADDGGGGRVTTRSGAYVGRFFLYGTERGLLAPGRALPINLVISNPLRFDIRVVSVSAHIRDITTRDGAPNPACHGSANATVVAALSADVVVPAYETRSLEQLGDPQSDWPRVAMTDLATNQDACKATRFSITFAGIARAG